MTQHAMTKQTMHTQSEHEDMPAHDTQRQMLSALIDGELSDDMARLTLKQLDHSDAERAHHANLVADYIAIGDAMRGLSTQHSGFTRRVMIALENEPVVLAPVRKPGNRRPALWLAAATVTAITWSLWQIGPRDEAVAPLALQQQAAGLTSQSAEAQPYLAAHQDFAQAVVSAPEMRFTKASLEIRQ